MAAWGFMPRSMNPMAPGVSRSHTAFPTPELVLRKVWKCVWKPNISRELRGRWGWRPKGRPPLLQVYLEAPLESQAVGVFWSSLLEGPGPRRQTTAQTHPACGMSSKLGGGSAVLFFPPPMGVPTMVVLSSVLDFWGR